MKNEMKTYLDNLGKLLTEAIKDGLREKEKNPNNPYIRHINNVYPSYVQSFAEHFNHSLIIDEENSSVRVDCRPMPEEDIIIQIHSRPCDPIVLIAMKPVNIGDELIHHKTLGWIPEDMIIPMLAFKYKRYAERLS